IVPGFSPGDTEPRSATGRRSGETSLQMLEDERAELAPITRLRERVIGALHDLYPESGPAAQRGPASPQLGLQLLDAVVALAEHDQQFRSSRQRRLERHAQAERARVGRRLTERAQPGHAGRPAEEPCRPSHDVDLAAGETLPGVAPAQGLAAIANGACERTHFPIPRSC